jgi:hypothetical protein
MKTKQRYNYPLTDKDKMSLSTEMFTLMNWNVEQAEVLVSKDGVDYSRLVNPKKEWIRLNKE